MSRTKLKVTLDDKRAENKSLASREIWWTNAIFFVAFHLVGLSAWYTWPSSWRTWFLYYINWQVGTLGITIGTQSHCPLTEGYHRLWSHRSFTARLPLRIILAAMGTLGFQGSIRFGFQSVADIDGGF